MKKLFLILAVVLMVGAMLAACSSGAAVDTVPVVKHPTQSEIYSSLPGSYDDGLILLDVRTPEEWVQDGHIEGATLLPVQQLEFEAEKSLAKDAEIVIYCRSGNRSAVAANTLLAMGYTNVSDIGGINDWKAAGYPVIYGP